MIEGGYPLLMARYNAWQNHQLSELVAPLSAEELTQDRGSFFGSILGTLNHLLWGDGLWMSRWSDSVTRPPGGIAESTHLTGSAQDWASARRELDGQILAWAGALGPADLAGDLSWYSGAQGREVRQPLATCIVHFFNHQTHHRGQVHAMLTAAGQGAPTSDLVFMPEDAGWP